MSDIANRLSQLSPEQRARLNTALLKRKAAKPSPLLGAVPRRDGPREAPLTVDQERIWMIHQFDKENPLYNVFFSVRVLGHFDTGHMQDTMRFLVRRHEALRTVFRMRDGAPVQIVQDFVEPQFEIVDLSHVAPSRDARQAEAERLARDEIRLPFDLETGPLIRMWVARESDASHLVVVTVDHLVWDRVSFGVFREELTRIYTAKVEGRHPDLPEIPIQFVDYATWQPKLMEAEVYPRQLPYWRRKLEGAVFFLDMPTEYPYPSVQTFGGARHYFTFSKDLSVHIRAFAQSQRSTINNVLLAVWGLVISRYARTDDVIVATTSSTRNRPELERTLGYFLTMSPLRIRPTDDKSFAALLKDTHRTMLEALDHRDTPFGTLLDELNIPRKPSRNPLYQTSFIMVDFQETAMRLPRAEVEPVLLDNRTAKDEILMAVWNDQALRDELFGIIEYNTDLFSAGFVANVYRHFETLVETVIQTPDVPLGEISMITNAEADDLARRYDGPKREGIVPGFHLAILEVAQAHPDRIAVQDKFGETRYKALAQRATVIAARLLDLGVKPSDLVAIFLDRSSDVIAAMLAVAMAGATYVPIDPSLPDLRVGDILSDAAPKVTLSSGVEGARLKALQADILDLDALAGHSGAEGVTPVRPIRDDLAYVIYTSGSTGKPKGVEVTHGGLSNLLASIQEMIGLNADDVLLAATSVSFDISGLELLAPLIAAGKVVVTPRETARDPRQIADHIEAHKVTAFQATPSALALLQEVGWMIPASIKLLVGGESLPNSLRSWIAKSGCVGWNLYGPTETTIWSSCWKIEAAGSISLGTPLYNTRFEVVSPEGKPCPTGIPGELWISGDGVARGYRNLPERTSQNFVATSEDGRRAFRTGDIVKQTHDGRLVYLGRDDGQIKLNGFRIEMAEVAAVLETHGCVNRAVAQIMNSGATDVRLVVYYTGTKQDARALQEFAAKRLPSYSLPSHYVHLDAMPLSNAGKIDMGALPDPEITQTVDAGPLSAAERAVLTLWQDVLNRADIDPGQTFFDLGGNSLQALRLMAKIEERFGKELPLMTVFQGNTVRDFARMLDGGHGQSSPLLLSLRPGDTGRTLFLAHPAGESVTCYTPLSRALDTDRSVAALLPREVDPSLSGVGQFSERTAAYVEAIKAFQPSGPYTLAGWCYGGIVAFDIARQLEAHGEEVSLFLINSHPPAVLSGLKAPRASMMFRGFAQNLFGDFDPDLITNERHDALTPDERIAHLQDVALRAPELKAHVSASRMKRMLGAWCANIELLRSFDTEQQVSQITMFVAKSEPPNLLPDWQKLSREAIRSVPIPGSHYSVIREPYVRDLALALQKAMLA